MSSPEESNVAQPIPMPGQVIPAVVQDRTVETPHGPDWRASVANAFVFPPGWEPGDKLGPGEGTLAEALDAEVRAGTITPAQASASAQASGLAGYTPPAV